MKYQQFQREQTASGVKTTIVLQGTYDACKKAMEGNGDGIEPEFGINHSHPTYGNLEQMRLSQDEGPIWNLELTYTTEINWLGISTSKGSSYGKTSSELNSRVQSMPLESHPDYHMNWNMNLYSTKADILSRGEIAANIRIAWANSGKANGDLLEDLEWHGDITSEPYIVAGGFVAWGKSLSELPDGIKEYDMEWYQILPMQKPGVDYYEAPVYELTETSKAVNKNKTAWNISKKLGKISMPSEGDFGVQEKLGGDWLCEGASTRFDGKYWLTTFTFLHSPDENGWDKDLYDVAKPKDEQ